MARDKVHAYPRENRLNTKRDIDRVFRCANRRMARGPVAIIGVPNKLTHPRLGMTVAKRHLPKAVHRNYVKRVIREWFRCNQSNLRNRDFIVILRHRPHDLASIRGCLDEIGKNPLLGT
ncbi:MAG: ribonuclease P protein component [Gammaproteobacteria bacterium]|nr:ribonuclease P protein component [Gammaproteobacteria bacterium]